MAHCLGWTGLDWIGLHWIGLHLSIPPLKCIPLEIVKERYFIENKIYGFEPMIVKTKSKRHRS